MTTESTKLQSGDVLLGRYHVEALIGRGMAEVYRVYDAQEERELALKILSKASEASGELRERLAREANAIAELAHPNVVTVLDTGHHEDGSFCFVMELLRGKPLGDYLRSNERFSERRILSLALEAARALHTVHEAGIVHRDIKPDNLFICESAGEPGGLKLLDFGLAQLPGERAHEEEAVAGTVEYMAPEQVVSDPVDARADIYALGVVMFRLLTNELPFDTEAQKPLLAHHLISPAPPPSWLVDGLDANIDTVVQTALRKHPTNRYPSMKHLCEDLERALNGAPALGYPIEKQPDEYLPLSDLGRRALVHLGTAHGHSIPESMVPPPMR